MEEWDAKICRCLDRGPTADDINTPNSLGQMYMVPAHCRQALLSCVVGIPLHLKKDEGRQCVLTNQLPCTQRSSVDSHFHSIDGDNFFKVHLNSLKGPNIRENTETC